MRARLRAVIAAAGLVALAGCAGVSEPAAAPAHFADVRSLVLVRSAEGHDARTKDPLDGLEETLRARGFTTRVVELGRRPPPEQAALDRLFRQLEVRASSTRADRVAKPLRDAGRDAGAVVTQLGSDAMVTYHRFERVHAPPLPPPPLAGAATVPVAPPPPSLPLGALVLVDRSGKAAVFAWGDTDALDDPGAPLNAAEAIEQLVRALTGEPEE